MPVSVSAATTTTTTTTAAAAATTTAATTATTTVTTTTTTTTLTTAAVAAVVAVLVSVTAISRPTVYLIKLMTQSPKTFLLPGYLLILLNQITVKISSNTLCPI